MMNEIHLIIMGFIPCKAKDKPNVVLMVMDNLGWGAIGAYGGRI
jgi:hypothetical protein